jgi:hypothetical protein
MGPTYASPIGQDHGMPPDVLDARALGRATLERQLLLRRSGMSPLAAVDHLVGMQAQVPLNPYLGLWSRLDGFRPDDVAALLLDRRVVRIVVMRGTIHLVTAEDCLLLRPLVQPVLDAELARHPDFGPALRGVDLEPVLAFARPLLAERPHTGAQLRRALAERFPDLDAAALAYACRNRLAFVQVPPRGVWGQSGQVTSTTAEAWLGRAPATRHSRSIDEVVLRYLAAFGPATVADVTTWCRLTGLREVVERLRPQLRTFADERGRELFDVPDGPLPDPATAAPPRYLPEYDNLLLSHADRSRVVPAELRGRDLSAAGKVQGSVLSDGSLCGVWRIDRDKATGAATLVVSLAVGLTAGAVDGLAEEGLAMVRFHEPAAAVHDVTFVDLTTA